MGVVLQRPFLTIALFLLLTIPYIKVKKFLSFMDDLNQKKLGQSEAANPSNEIVNRELESLGKTLKFWRQFTFL